MQEVGNLLPSCTSSPFFQPTFVVDASWRESLHQPESLPVEVVLVTQFHEGVIIYYIRETEIHLEMVHSVLSKASSPEPICWHHPRRENLLLYLL